MDIRLYPQLTLNTANQNVLPWNAFFPNFMHTHSCGNLGFVAGKRHAARTLGRQSPLKISEVQVNESDCNISVIFKAKWSRFLFMLV